MSSLMVGLAIPQLLQILSLCALFGGLGGFAAHLVNNEKVGLREPVDGWFAYPAKWQSVIIGAAGAIGVLFFLVAIGGLADFSDLAAQLRTISVSVLAGYGARTILPRMASQLERQVEKALLDAEVARDEAKRASGEASEATKRIEEARRDAEVQLASTERRLAELELHSKLLEATNPAVQTSVWREALERGRAAIDSGSAKPHDWINLARVERRHVSLPAAIETLDRFIAEVEAGRVVRDRNYGAAYFNRACYRLLATPEDQRPGAVPAIIADLEAHLRLSTNLDNDVREMLTDTDLASLRDDPLFQQLVRRHAPQNQ